MIPAARRLAALAFVAVTVAVAAGTMLAALGATPEAEPRRRGRRREAPVSLSTPNTPYDGKFTFVRLQYGATLGGGWGLCRHGRTTIRAPSETS